MKKPTEESTQEATQLEIELPLPPLHKIRIRFSLILALFGFLMMMIGAQPGWFGMDRSPVVGFVQIAVMLVGLGIICANGYVAIHSLWRKQAPSIPADFGLRLVSTGYVVAVFSAMADIFGIGSHPLPGVPLFGVWQARGMEIGLAMIAIGFVMMFPFRKQKK